MISKYDAVLASIGAVIAKSITLGTLEIGAILLVFITIYAIFIDPPA